ncbi:MarR family winged helix-turn-helix transcriptional regulator [Streptomyces sp. LN785]|uniref:MarR family winged helix-turn-helix transcriptional regulator n=1 Tax=Streptomyces sp. LN785 TaxID=3112983 RepID=UPI003722FA03
MGTLHGELRVRHRLSLRSYLVLGALAEAADGSLPLAQLTASLRESGDRMSYLLRGLQAAGLVESDRRQRDRRTVEVALTDSGRARFADAVRTAQALTRRQFGPGPVTALAESPALAPPGPRAPSLPHLPQAAPIASARTATTEDTTHEQSGQQT